MRYLVGFVLVLALYACGGSESTSAYDYCVNVWCDVYPECDFTVFATSEDTCKSVLCDHLIARDDVPCDAERLAVLQCGVANGDCRELVNPYLCREEYDALTHCNFSVSLE